MGYVIGSLAVFCIILGWNFLRLRWTTMALINDTLMWHVNCYWVQRKAPGYEIFLGKHWGYVNEVTIKTTNDVVVFVVKIPIKSSGIHVETVSPKISKVISNGHIYAFESVINQGLRAMHVPDLDEEKAIRERATRQ